MCFVKHNTDIATEDHCYETCALFRPRSRYGNRSAASMRYGLSCRSYISTSNKKINDKPWHSYMYKKKSPTSIKMFR